MRYLHTMVRVTDVEKSLHFYCDLLGLREKSRTENEEGRYTLIFLAAPKDWDQAAESSAPLVELTYNWPGKDGETEELQGGRNFGHLAYAVDNIYETCEKLQKGGVTINRPPRDGRMAFVKSPEGISIELLQNGDPLDKQEPWASMENSGSW